MKHFNQLIFLSFFFLSIAFVSCKKKSINENTSPTPNNSPTDTTTNYFLFAEIDGVSWNTGDTTTRFYEQTQTIGWYFDPLQNALQTDYSAYFIHKDAVNADDFTHGQIRVNFSGYTYTTYNTTPNGGFEISCADFQSSLSIPITSFYSNATFNQPGFEIVYLDTNYEKWSSKLGDQTGSGFAITYNQTTNPMFGYQSCARKYRGTFHCKVYKQSDPSQFKVITNGLFHAYINKYDE